MKKVVKRVLVLALIVMIVMSMAAPASAEAGYYDEIYYNVSNLTATEIEAMTELPVGTVIVMYPTSDKYYVGTEAENLVINGTVKIVCMSGAGSSSVASASMARHIALAKKQPVASIVVGMGEDTVYQQISEGYFTGRTNNVYGTTYSNDASSKLVTLYSKGARPSLLVGHSKGNFDIANALYMMYRTGKKSWYNGVTFKTFGCGVNVPSGVTLKQYMGSMDSMGYTNTVSYKNMTYIWGRYHTLNLTDYPTTYLPIEKYV